MRIDDVRTAQRGQPFRPFTIHVADGRQFTVGHPEMMAIAPTGRSFIVYDLDGNWEIIDPMLVTSLSLSADHAATA